ncbi:MAG: hypothetical protein ACKVY0_00970 [Prosthecobacter sp.]|uniref:hypothetical protein n=1 Tax=Prosthecobacter sp. TaxID=1965333 RepID=UPI0038FDEB68
MGKHRKQHREPHPSWPLLKDKGLLTERHVLMATALGLKAEDIQFVHRTDEDGKGLLLLEWVEDRHLAAFGTVVPIDDKATPESQQEHPAEYSLLPDPSKIMNDYIYENAIIPGSDDEPDWYEEVGQRIEESEKNTPVSYGEIYDEDRRMLRHQEDFRRAARLLSKNLEAMPEVTKVVLFGSTALPLWKEVPRFSRLRSRRIKIYHECSNIDLAIWVTTTARANDIRKLAPAVVNEQVDNDDHLSVAHHHYSMHLIDHRSANYLGMVCHYNQCPKRKEPCRVPGCGAQKFVRILPGFKLKPERLHSHNSQTLFVR